VLATDKDPLSLLTTPAAFVLIRGAYFTVGSYPYPFLDVTKHDYRGVTPSPGDGDRRPGGRLRSFGTD